MGQGSRDRKYSAPRIRGRCTAGHVEARAGRSDPIGTGLPRGAGKGAGGGRRIGKYLKENPLWPSTLATADERASEADKGMPLGSRYHHIRINDRPDHLTPPG